MTRIKPVPSEPVSQRLNVKATEEIRSPDINRRKVEGDSSAQTKKLKLSQDPNTNTSVHADPDPKEFNHKEVVCSTQKSPQQNSIQSCESRVKSRLKQFQFHEKENVLTGLKTMTDAITSNLDDISDKDLELD